MLTGMKATLTARCLFNRRAGHDLAGVLIRLANFVLKPAALEIGVKALYCCDYFFLRPVRVVGHLWSPPLKSPRRRNASPAWFSMMHQGRGTVKPIPLYQKSLLIAHVYYSIVVSSTRVSARNYFFGPRAPIRQYPGALYSPPSRV